jgi:hypothetical protein
MDTNQDLLEVALLHADQPADGELEIKLGTQGVPELLKRELGLGRIFWARAVHDETIQGAPGWRLELVTIGAANFADNPVDVLRAIARAKDYEIPDLAEGTLAALRAHFDREATATGPEFESASPGKE